MHTHTVAHLREHSSMATRFVRWRHGNVEQQQEERKQQILSSILAKNGHQKMVIFGPFWTIEPSKMCVSKTAVTTS